MSYDLENWQCYYQRLQQVEASEYEYPNQIYEVPVKTYFLYHFVVTTTLINTIYCVYQYQNVEDNT